MAARQRVEREVQVDVSLVSEDQIFGRQDLPHYVYWAPLEPSCFRRGSSLETQSWSTRLFSGPITAGKVPGKVTLEASLGDGSHVLLKKS